MACKIQIKQNITEVVMERTDPVMGGSLERAQAVARGVNSDFETNVVSINKVGDVLVRNISIPNALIDEYYDNEVAMEAEEDEESPEEIAEGVVNYQFRAVKNLTDNMSKVNQWFKQMKDSDAFWKKVQQDLQIPKDQVELLRASEGTTPEEKIASFAANYSFTVQTDITREEEIDQKLLNDGLTPTQETLDRVNTPTQHYSYLTVPGGTNYTENEIATPGIVPAIKGHAQFATDQGIGWYRSDDKAEEGTGYDPNELYEDEEGNLVSGLNRGTSTKTRRVLEVQSDLFQKGREKKDLHKREDKSEQWGWFDVGNYRYRPYNINLKTYTREDKNNLHKTEYITKEQHDEALAEFEKDTKENLFLQLLNKSNNWVNFFVKSIIQDSAKKGYEKVLFPSGDTASKVEGHESLEELKKQKEERLERLRTRVTRNGLTFTKKGDKYYKQQGVSDKIEITKEIFDEVQSANNTEIAQLESELRRVETEGFGALAPIYNFYENVVANVLRKQGYNPATITDEHGNTWQEVTIETKRDTSPVMLQLDNVPASRAAQETLVKMKEVAKQMGIKFEDLAEYCRQNPAMEVTGAAGVADLAKGTIAIAQGREGVALIEEIVHMATAMLEQANPGYMTSLISKIGNYKIYKQVFAEYSKNKHYQLSDGKPDIRKIKKEAVDKLIAELVVFQSEGSTEFPELMDKNTRGMIMGWWESILNTISALFGRSTVDLFESTAEKIASGEVGVLSDFDLDGIYLQTEVKPNKVVDNHYNTLMEDNKNMRLFDQDKKDRHYTYKDERVDSTVTEKIKKGKPEIKASKEEQEIYDQMQGWGSEGHDFLKAEFLTNLIDENGYANSKALANPIDTKLSPEIQRQLKKFAKQLIKSYPPGTRFIIEKMVVNKKVKGMLASTVDFKALIPVENPDGTQDMFIDTLDWKFTTIKEGEEDIPWYKQGDWKPQMEEYVKMDHAAGAKSYQTRKSRMVPFIVTYGDKVKGKPKAGIVPKSLEIGNLDSVKETKLYLLPVPINTESTGNTEIDMLIQALQSQWDKLWDKKIYEETDRQKKTRDLNEISKAIRQLHLQLDFAPLRDVGETFLNNASAYIKNLDKIKITDLNKGELNALLEDLHSYKDSSEKYANLDKAFLAKYSKDKLTPEQTTTLNTFRRISRATDAMIDRLEEFEKQVTMELGVRQGIISEDQKMTILEAEAAIDSFSGAFKEASKLPSKIINLATNLIMTASEVTKRKTAKQIKEFGKVLLPLEEIANKRGKKAFDMVGKMEDGKMSLIKKLSPEFWEKVAKANKDKKRKFFAENMNMADYITDIEEAIKKGEEDLDKREFDVDPDTADYYRDMAKERLRNKLDIRRKTFNGYDTKSFSYYFNKNIKEEGHYSKEYEEMAKTPEALAVWEFFTQLNRDAKAMGYLGQQGASFFPLIEATTLEKFNQTSDVYGQTKDFFKDFYTMTVNEANQYSMIDPETGKVKKQIPKYFTKSNKTVEQLSTDLNKVGSLWIQALNDYQNSKDMEFTLLTLQAVEQAKGSLVIENGAVAMKGLKPIVDYSNNKNAQLLQTIIDDAIYRLTENLDSFGNVNIASVTEKFSKDEESKERNVVAVKKAVKNADTLIQALAVGLKPLIGFANWAGGQFQAYINSGNKYLFGEFMANNVKVSTGQLNEMERGLLDLIMPLNEDITIEERRKLAKQQGLGKYLSTWSFTDVMMSTNSFPERRLQYANALSFNENSMVVDGEIINIRQHVKKQDSKKKYEKDEDGKYIMSNEERRALEKTFEDRVKELKESSSLLKIAKIENDEVVIPGVTEEALAKYALSIKEYMRELNGQMNPDNKAGYRRDTMMTSFMMFKNWIPKLLSVRTLDIHKNVEIDEWQYGRTRAFLKTVVHLGKNSITGMTDIILGTEEGLRILDEMLAAKKADYYKRTGQVLDISQEEFNDMIRTQLENQVKELKLLLGLLAIVFAAGVAVPPEDATDQEKNLYKYMVKGINKVTDEVTFYFNPISFETMTSGRMLPAVGILSKLWKIFDNVGRESIGLVTGNEEMSKKAHGLKYTFNLMPGFAQFQTEVLPYIFPDISKDWGIRVTSQSRRE